VGNIGCGNIGFVVEYVSMRVKANSKGKKEKERKT